VGTPSHPRPSEGLGATTGSTAAVVVIGATGTLRPASVTLAESGATVVAVARDTDRLDQLTADLAYAGGGVVSLAADATRPDFPEVLGRLLRHRRLRMESVLAYGPATSTEVLDELLRLIDGVLVEILVSRHARPRGDRPWTLDDLPAVAEDGHRRLVLGWHREGDSARWHTTDEISSAALAALATPGDRVLGVVSPWPDRPT